MVSFEEGQSRMRVEGVPVEVGFVIWVNEIWTEVAVAVAAGFAVSVLSVAELGYVDDCVCAADAASVR